MRKQNHQPLTAKGTLRGFRQKRTQISARAPSPQKILFKCSHSFVQIFEASPISTSVDSHVEVSASWKGEPHVPELASAFRYAFNFKDNKRIWRLSQIHLKHSTQRQARAFCRERLYFLKKSPTHVLFLAVVSISGYWTWSTCLTCSSVNFVMEKLYYWLSWQRHLIYWRHSFAWGIQILILYLHCT